MVFSSIVFIMFFLLGTLILYYNPIFKSRNFKNVILFLTSLFFYAWGEPIFVFLFILSIIFNYVSGMLIDKHEGKSKKVIFIANLVFNIGLLFVFKYLSFIISNVAFIFKTDWKIEIALPLGISFFTFQIMSYIIDVYKKRVPVQRNFMYLGLYISMFPQLVAGPIVRYETIQDEIVNRKENWDDFTAGLYRFVYGLAKKVLIANSVALLADKAFGLTAMSVFSAWLGVIAYTLQIYFDFSGYSDMAIGLGKMFGFHFNENFEYPYISKSITEFWRRWHISLSSWFRDYVYIPLGGNRVSKPRWLFNIFVVWLLTGFWHGANWTFVVWGLFYFVILLIEKLTGFAKNEKFIGHIYTMLIVMIAWVFFRADSLVLAFKYIGNMFGIGVNGFADALAVQYFMEYKVYLIVGIIAALPIKKWIEAKFTKKAPKIYNCSEGIYIVALFVLCISNLLATSYNPFIYFNF